VRRSLSPDEAGLWARVMATVRPMRATPMPFAQTEPLPKAAPGTPRLRVANRPAALPVAPVKPRQANVANTLDGGWDKRIARGGVIPDMTLDLHGHTLASAHAMLDDGIARALRQGARVILLVTGRPPRPESERPHARGAIRAAIGDWLGASRHADAIAAVRGAHPRHGGLGALYIVLRRPRER